MCVTERLFICVCEPVANSVQSVCVSESASVQLYMPLFVYKVCFCANVCVYCVHVVSGSGVYQDIVNLMMNIVILCYMCYVLHVYPN